MFRFLLTRILAALPILLLLSVVTFIIIKAHRAMLVLPDGEEVAFPLDPFARQCLTQGIDELEYLRRHETAIAVWEARHG